MAQWWSLSTTLSERLEAPAGDAEFARLIAALDRSFFTGKPQLSPRHLERYTDALGNICEYMHAKGAPSNILSEVQEFYLALRELRNGTVRPFLRATRFNNPVEPDDLWSCRAFVCLGIDLLIQGGMSKSSAMVYLETNYGLLQPLLAASSDTFSGGADSWRRRFHRGECKSEIAQRCFDSFPKKQQQNTDCTRLGKQILDEAFVEVLKLDNTHVAPETWSRIRREAERRGLKVGG